MEHESDGETMCNWCAQYSHQKTDTETGGLGNKNWELVKVTYLGIRSAHERVWLVEEKPIWLPRAYLTRGDLEPAKGNVHVCKLVRELTNIQTRTVTAERVNDSECSCPTNALQLNEGRKEGRRTREKAREKEQLPREGESAQLNTPWNQQ